MAVKIKYIAGGTLPPDSALYQERPADSELLTLCLDGQFAYVLTSRQMGKSSLMARTARKLQEQGIHTAIIDLTSIGTRATSAEQWYLGVLSPIESYCSPETDLFVWWQNNAALPPAQRFSNYISAVLLKEIHEKIVIFVDEIDSTLGLGFTDDFFAAIRAFHNGRATHPDLYRISFVLLGVATPDELIRDRARTPFNIGQAVELNDFGFEQVLSLIQPLKLGASEQSVAVQILKWTGGQPYLTLKLCALLADKADQSDKLETLILSNWLRNKFKGDSHFQFITSYLAVTPQHYKKEVFETYEDCYRGKNVLCRDASFAHNRLRLSGLLKRQDGTMIIRNEIYRKLFDRKWIKENRPTFWTERNKKFALYLFSAACLALAAFMIYLWLLSSRLAYEATSLRLQVEAQAMLSDAMAGTDLLAKQKSAASFRIVESYKDYGVLPAIDRTKSFGGLLGTLAVPNKNLWIGHSTESIFAVAFSPDSKRIVSGSSDKTLRLWDANTGAAIGPPLEGHEGVVLSVAFSPDGKRIVSGSRDKTLRLWDVGTGAAIGQPLKGHEDSIRSVAFSPDGKRIVSGSWDKTLRLWDANTGAAIGQPLKGHESDVYSVAFSPDSKRIVSGSPDNTLRLWDANTGAAIGQPLKGHESDVYSVAFSPDGKRIISGSSDKTLRLWDADTGAAIGQPLKGHENDVLSVAFSPDGMRIVSGSSDKTLRLWNADTGAAIGQPLKGHESDVYSVAFSPDGKRIVSGSSDKTLRFWDANTGAAIGQPLKGHEDIVWSVAFSPDSKRIVSGSWDNTLRLWDANTGAAIGQPLKGHEDVVWSVAFSPDSKRIVSGSWDNTLRLWDANTGAAIGQPLKGHESDVYSVAFSPDSKRIVSGSWDNTLRLWDADTGAAIGQPLKGHENDVMSVAFSPDGMRIVSGSSDKTLRLWNAGTGAAIGQPLKGHESDVYSVAFSPDGKRIVSGSSDKTLRLWDANTGAAIGQPLKGHEDIVYSVAFSPDGKRIVSGSSDKTLRLWESGTGAAFGQPLAGHLGSVLSVAFSPDGKRIVSGSRDKTLWLWLAPDLWIDELCKKITRNMTYIEWRDTVSKDIGYIKQCPDLPIPPDEPESTPVASESNKP